MYSYDRLLRDIDYFKSMGVSVFSIGKSRLKRDIVCFKTGCGGKAVISTAAIHARENASAYVVREQLKAALREKWRHACYFIPLVNPDGAEILLSGLKENSEQLKLYKANAAGVDLNVNFPARWGSGASNKRRAGGSDYIGAYPLCEPESAALARFTMAAGAAATLSYHTAGRELYWYFYQTGAALKRDFALAKGIERQLKFKYGRIDSALSSAGGYKDWCISRLNIPAFTIELGLGSHPLFRGDLKEDIRLSSELVLWLSARINA